MKLVHATKQKLALPTEVESYYPLYIIYSKYMIYLYLTCFIVPADLILGGGATCTEVEYYLSSLYSPFCFHCTSLRTCHSLTIHFIFLHTQTVQVPPPPDPSHVADVPPDPSHVADVLREVLPGILRDVLQDVLRDVLLDSLQDVSS